MRGCDISYADFEADRAGTRRISPCSTGTGGAVGMVYVDVSLHFSNIPPGPGRAKTDSPCPSSDSDGFGGQPGTPSDMIVVTVVESGRDRVAVRTADYLQYR
jgi:hypothetical protein